MTSVLYRVPHMAYPKAVKASGMYIEDESGKQYLDMSGGAAVSALGHAHPHVLETVTRQVSRLDFAHTAFFTTDVQEQLASRLAQRYGDTEALAYFTSGGSEANETAVKLCWQYWKARGEADKKIIVSREHSYHGNTLGMLSISGNAARRRASAAPLLDWPRISPCYAYRYCQADESASAYALRAADELEAAILDVGASRIAAFICEPIVGSSLGVVAAEAGYLERVREICDHHEILWIADEIMCGSGRSGSYFAFEHHGARPDIVTLAKGIGGGYMPLAATIMSGRIARELRRSGFAHGHTYVGHPVSCAAGLAVQEVLDREGLLQRTRVQGALLGKVLRDRFGEHPNVGDIRGRGLFWALELVANRETRAGFHEGAHLPGRLLQLSLEEGLIVYPGSIEVDGACVPHLMIAPPMIIEESHMMECVDKLQRVLDQALDA